MRKISESREKELDKTCPIVYQEIERGGCETLKEHIETYGDDYISYALWYSGLIKSAIEFNNVKALKVFFDAGVHPDTVLDLIWSETLLLVAIFRKAHIAAACLLDAGADVNYTNNGEWPSPLVWAAGVGDFQLVKLFIERGADIHYTYYYGGPGTKKLNALTQAVKGEHHEIADYLCSLGVVMPLQDENPPRSLTPEEELLADLSKYFKGKPLEYGISEIVPASVPLTVHIFPPVKGKRKNTIFVTSGLIEYALVVPEDKEYYCFAEYFIEMPGAWSVQDKDLQQEKYLWPITWLKAIARYPHEQETYYGDRAIVDKTMIPFLTMPDGKYDSALVELVTDCDFQKSDGINIFLYRVIPQKSSASPLSSGEQ